MDLPNTIANRVYKNRVKEEEDQRIGVEKSLALVP